MLKLDIYPDWTEKNDKIFEQKKSAKCVMQTKRNTKEFVLFSWSSKQENNDL